jgi:xylulokinase
MQIVSDITGKEIGTSGVTIGASFGDAMMAAMGIRYFKSFAELGKIIKPGTLYRPNMENHGIYQKYQALFDALYPSTRELMHRL